MLTDGTRSAWEGPSRPSAEQPGTELVQGYRVTHYNMTEGRQQWNRPLVEV